MAGDDVVDLAAYRQRRREPAPEPEPVPLGYVRVKVYGEPVLWPADDAERFARELLTVARRARRLMQPRPANCAWCGVAGCRDWHVRQIRRGWHRGKRVVAVVDRVCARSVRMVTYPTPETFYVSRKATRTWDVVGAVGPLPVDSISPDG